MVPTTILICPDSFKGTLTAVEAASAIEQGVRAACPHCTTIKMPLADGGYGTLDVVASLVPHRMIEKKVRGPLGIPVKARYLILKKKTAFIEAAQTIGLPLIPENKRNPLVATSFGVGELIIDAVAHGCSTIMVSLGGSGTVDGGMGMAQACGARFFDRRGIEVRARKSEGYAGSSLEQVARIDVAGIAPALKKTRFIALADVTNPLCGPNGAARVFGPQKGATPGMVRDLDRWLRSYAKALERATGRATLATPGSGAAGGIGAALLAFFDAKITPGIDTVMHLARFEDFVKKSDLIVTGEGRIDSQTAAGKTISGIASVAKRNKVPVVAIGGCLGQGFEAVAELGVGAIYDASNGKRYSFVELKKHAFGLLRAAAQKAMREFPPTV